MKQYATLKIGSETFEILDSGGFVIFKGITDKRFYIWDVTQAINQVSANGWDIVEMLEKNDKFHYYLVRRDSNG